MPPRPFVLRLIFPFAMLIVLVVAAGGALLYYTGEQNVRAQQIHDLDRLTRLVREQISNDISISAGQSQRLRDLGSLLDSRITLIDGEGVVFFDTYHDAKTMANHNDRPEISQARRGQIGSSVRASDTLNGEPAVYAAQLLDSTNPGGAVVRLSYPKRTWAASARLPAGGVLIGVIAAAALLIAAMAMLLQRQWIGPVRAIADVAEKISRGQWDARVEPTGAEEVELLAARFNTMADEAQRRLTELAHQRADLQALVDSLPDPILLSDAAQRITILNLPAAKLLQLPAAQAIGKRVDVVVNEESLLSVIEQAKSSESDSATAREVRLVRGGQKVTYHALAARAKTGGVLLVMRNVSAMAATVQMKTDFVANASHELRTPISAIKVAFETLAEVYHEDPQQADRCIAIIGGHLRRLEEMLVDLLDLSKVESPDLHPYLAPIRASELVTAVNSSVGQNAKEKGVDLQFEIQLREGEFDSDARLLNLVLRNLVENSIKFTASGGTIRVKLARENGEIVLSVADNGIGIPPEHQQRVFERFYQVNAARSGSAGRGTGLGLAIVKHAIHALRGTVTLTSAVGAGTTVTCALPERARAENA